MTAEAQYFRDNLDVVAGAPVTGDVWAWDAAQGKLVITNMGTQIELDAAVAAAPVLAPATSARNLIQPSADVVPLTLQGQAAGQAQPLLLFKSSAGVDLGLVTSGGILDLGAVSASAPSGSGGTVGDKITLYRNTSNIEHYGIGVQSGRAVVYVGAGGAFGLRRSSSGAHRSAGTEAVTLWVDGGTEQILNSTTRVGQIIKLAASASADAFQIQDSAGAVLAKFTNIGDLYIGTARYSTHSSGRGVFIGGGSQGEVFTTGGAFRSDLGLNCSTVGTGTSLIPNTLRGGTSSWQIDFAPSTTGDLFVFKTLNGAPAYSGVVKILSPNVGAVGLIVRGFAGQSADLFRAEASDAVAKVRVTGGGNLTIEGQNTPFLTLTSLASARSYSFLNDSGYFRLQSNDAAGALTIRDSASLKHMELTFGAGTYFYSPVVGAIPLRVQGFAAQTGDLTRWQDSAGATLAAVTAGGLLNLTPAGGTSAAGGGAVGDKIALYATEYGIGLQSGALVLWGPIGDSSSGVAIRAVAPSGNKSSGPDVHRLVTCNNLTVGTPDRYGHIQTPVVGGAFTLDRFNYFELKQPTGAATITNATVLAFNAAAGTHKAVDAATTKTTPGGVDAWVKINVNGTLQRIRKGPSLAAA